MKRLSLNAPNIVDQLGQLHSVYPATEYLTFGPWIYLVPQYKPESVLMLGYGGGTAAGLIRLFYGDVPITAVDMDDCSEFNYYDVELIQADAAEYVKTCQRSFDTVIVDLFREGSYYPEAFVLKKPFVQDLKRIGNYLIVHTVTGDDLSAYEDLHHVRTLSTNSGSKFQPAIHYYMVKEVPIPVR